LVRALRGWILAAAGAVLLLGCYLGVSREELVSRQLPYLVSGGFGGLALVIVGSALLVADRAAGGRALELRQARQIDDLHALIVAATTAGSQQPAQAAQASATTPAGAQATVPGLSGPVGQPAMSGGQGDGLAPWLAVPAGRTFHRPGCDLVTGKPALPVGPAEVETRGLTPCKVCTPLAAPVP
jgi:hypothetical protein